jgi:sRNA-binding regulator protein Hfq
MQKLYRLIPAFLSLLFMPLLTSAQEDKIYLHNGSTIVGKVLGVDSDVVNFVYLKMENVKCTRHAIEKIVYKSGKTDLISPRVVVTSKEDWQKVVVLGPKDDISALKYQGFIGDIRKPVTPDMMSDKEALRKLQEEAAAKGFPFVQISAKKNIAYSYN